MSQRNETSFSLHVENTKHEKYVFLIGCISSSLGCFSITKKIHESFPARSTLRDNFLINEIGDTRIRYSHCLIARRGPDLFNYTSSSVECCFLLDAVREKYSYVSYATLYFICRIAEFNRNYMKRTKFVCDLSA